MMIPSPAAGDPYARAAALERTLRASPADGAAAPFDGSQSPPPSPDVVVTLGQGSASPGTYDAAGRVAAPSTPDDTGADAPDPMAQATEDDGGHAPDAPSEQDAASAP